MFKKNTAVVGFGIGHFVGVADGIAVTTGTPTCKRTLDGVGGACANAASYNSDGAVWEIDLDAGDMNGDVVVLSFELAGCIPISYTIKTSTVLVSELNDFDPAADAVSLVTTVTNLTNLPAAAALEATAQQILEDTGTTLPGLLSGAGSTAYSNTVTDSDSNPLDGVEVWITSDSGGASTVASTTTDTLGAFTVYLDPGTYYLWLAKGGYNFGNPTTITVS